MQAVQTGWHRHRWLFHGVMLTAIAVLVVLNLVKLSQRHHAAQIGVYGRVPEFALTERNGKPFQQSDLRGKVWIADFIFTRCAGPCPLMSAKMSGLQRSLKDAAGVRFVSFSVDPEYDTPNVLAEYAGKFGADPDRWFFLTGDKKAVFTLANQGFRVGAADNPPDHRQPDEGAILHSTSFVLVDGNGNIRGYYDGTDANGIERLLKDARILLRKGPL